MIDDPMQFKHIINQVRVSACSIQNANKCNHQQSNHNNLHKLNIFLNYHLSQPNHPLEDPPKQQKCLHPEDPKLLTTHSQFMSTSSEIPLIPLFNSKRQIPFFNGFNRKESSLEDRNKQSSHIRTIRRSGQEVSTTRNQQLLPFNLHYQRGERNDKNLPLESPTEITHHQKLIRLSIIVPMFGIVTNQKFVDKRGIPCQGLDILNQFDEPNIICHQYQGKKICIIETLSCICLIWLLSITGEQFRKILIRFGTQCEYQYIFQQSFKNHQRIYYTVPSQVIMAVSFLVLGHILIPLITGVSYCYFILILNQSLTWSIVFLSIFGVLFLLYSLAASKLLRSHPGEPNKSQLTDERIQELKRNQLNRIDLLQIMEKETNITYQQLWDLQKEYIQLYALPSFCTSCQNIKPPRAYHCQQCKQCIVRRQKHSDLIHMCIGQKNMKIFMQYLCIAMIMSAFMIGSVIFVTVYEYHKLNDVTDFELVLFAVIEMTLGTSLILFIKEFSISYYNSTENITETQRKMKIINSKSIFSQTKTILLMRKTIIHLYSSGKLTTLISGTLFSRLNGSTFKKNILDLEPYQYSPLHL